MLQVAAARAQHHGNMAQSTPHNTPTSMTDSTLMTDHNQSATEKSATASHPTTKGTTNRRGNIVVPSTGLLDSGCKATTKVAPAKKQDEKTKNKAGGRKSNDATKQHHKRDKSAALAPKDKGDSTHQNISKGEASHSPFHHDVSPP